MIRVKICGLTNLADAQWAAQCGADALGFVLYPKSRRYVSEHQVAKICDSLPPYVVRVGVFVNVPWRDVLKAVRRIGLNAAQLQGEESPAACRALAREGVGIIKTFRVGDDARFMKHMRRYQVDGFLLDRLVPGMEGGTGRTFDWRLAVQAKGVPYLILSGGLTPQNVTRAIRQVRPDAVDVSSGVERQTGVKDRRKVRLFIQRAKLKT